MDGMQKSDTLADENLRRHLEAANTRHLLALSGLFLVAWELVENAVVEGVRDFFTVGFDERGFTLSDDYQKRVLHRAKHEFDACLGWLVEVDALSDVEAMRPAPCERRVIRSLTNSPRSS